MELKLINHEGQSSSTLAASDELFGRDYNEALIHQVVTAYQANARQGTRAQKSRGRADGQKSEAARSQRRGDCVNTEKRIASSGDAYRDGLITR